MQSDIYTDSINEDFIDDFILYLEGEDLRMNYINGLLALVKSMVSKAGKAGYAVDPSFDIVEYDHEESFSIALSIIEIARIYYFIGLTRFQERIRDFFILSCLTALRFSDYSTLTEENFGKENLTKMTQKTKKKVVIPLHQIVKDIHAKYDGDITLNKSSQYFNRAIKQICKKVGLDDPITYSYTKGGKYITETKPKWQLVKSHTGRRSMATNLKLTGRISTHEIMSLLGHSNESTTNKYLKITKEDDARSIGGDSYFRI
jgi:integrase